MEREKKFSEKELGNEENKRKVRLSNGQMPQSQIPKHAFYISDFVGKNSKKMSIITG